MPIQVICILIGLIACIATVLFIKAWEVAKDMDKKDENKNDGRN